MTLSRASTEKVAVGRSPLRGAEGLAKNTLVFFWSDNGDVGMSPVERRLRGTKFGHYEGGHRVPTEAWWPGKIKAKTKSKALVLGFDLYLTFTELA